jgi:UDP-sulfoquinovose synthase
VRALVLGADGYLGWPTCMYFSGKGHEVMAVDNYFRRRAALELDCEPLVQTPNLAQRARRWKEISGRDIRVSIGDVTDYGYILKVFREFAPEVVVHYAEQPSAPYSMIDRDRAAFTLRNNLVGTLNVAYAVRETDPGCHVIKLGTMGEYGTPDIDIEEGWIEILHKGRSQRFLFPRQASSLYHTTKVQDTDMLWFYVRTWGLRVTDLMQGPVYGISTDESDMDAGLMPNFHYDEVFGTVVNRFVVQAAIGMPLTVYGKGTQIRGYLNLKDTMQCVHLSAREPAGPGELRVFNQITETFSVNELALRVKEVGDRLGYNVRVEHHENPRVESEEHYYNPKYTGLLELGLQPHYLTDEVIEAMFGVVERHRDRINREAIFRGIRWA